MGMTPDDLGDEEFFDADGFDPDRLVGCAYWRCDEIFERRSANHVFCRKACRSRQRKWESSVRRKERRAAKKHQTRTASQAALTNPERDE